MSFFLGFRGGFRGECAWAVDVHELLCGTFAGQLRVRCYRSGEPRNNDSALWNAKKGKGSKGPLGRAPPKGPSSVPLTVSERPHVVPPRGAPPGAGVRPSQWNFCSLGGDIFHKQKYKKSVDLPGSATKSATSQNVCM